MIRRNKDPRPSISRRSLVVINLMSALVLLAMVGLVLSSWSDRSRIQKEAADEAERLGAHLSLVAEKRRVQRNRTGQTDALAIVATIETFQRQNSGAFPEASFLADDDGQSGYGYPYVLENDYYYKRSLPNSQTPAQESFFYGSTLNFALAQIPGWQTIHIWRDYVCRDNLDKPVADSVDYQQIVSKQPGQAAVVYALEAEDREDDRLFIECLSTGNENWGMTNASP